MGGQDREAFVLCRQKYGDLYSVADFHARAGPGYDQHGNCQLQEQDLYHCYDCVHQCDLGGLADLDTSKPYVQAGTRCTLKSLDRLLIIHE